MRCSVRQRRAAAAEAARRCNDGGAVASMVVDRRAPGSREERERVETAVISEGLMGCRGRTLTFRAISKTRRKLPQLPLLFSTFEISRWR
jgi:hypothetical protein